MPKITIKDLNDKIIEVDGKIVGFDAFDDEQFVFYKGIKIFEAFETLISQLDWEVDRLLEYNDEIESEV